MPVNEQKHRPLEAPCPGCGQQTGERNIACRRCFLIIPGHFKESFAATTPGTTERKRVVAAMRTWLRERRPDRPEA